MIAPLEEQAANFAKTLTDIFTAVLPYEVPAFHCQNVRPNKADRLQVGPRLDESLSKHNDSLFSHIMLRDKGQQVGEECLSLKALFTVDNNDPDGHMRVLRSTMGLWLDASPQQGQTRQRPVFRVEFERNKRNGPPAHIHFHAESAELSWLYGRAGKPMVSMSEVHFPVGSTRFRPTIEDVLKFLDDEDLFTNWKPEWRNRLKETLDDWHQAQAAAAARTFPEAAAEALRKKGYIVTAPPDN